jgi:hypothetical protein
MFRRRATTDWFRLKFGIFFCFISSFWYHRLFQFLFFNFFFEIDPFFKLPRLLSSYIHIGQLFLSFFGAAEALPFGKLKLTGRNLERVFNSRIGCLLVCALHLTIVTNIAQLKVENSSQGTFRFSPLPFALLHQGSLTDGEGSVWLTSLY